MGGGGTLGRIGMGVVTGVASELDRAGIGAGAGLSGKVGTSLGGGGKGGKNGGPTPPDFAGMAEQQGASAHIDQNGPLGSTGWTQGADGRWTPAVRSRGGPRSEASRTAIETAMGVVALTRAYRR